MFLILNLTYSQSKSETIEYINDKLKTHSSLDNGHYEIEVSKYGNMSLHSYSKSSFSQSNDDLHFIEVCDFIDINIKPKVGTIDGEEYYEIIFECKDSNNCVSLKAVHNNYSRGAKWTSIGINNKKVYLSLLEKFNYLKKISSKL